MMVTEVDSVITACRVSPRLQAALAEMPAMGGDHIEPSRPSEALT